MCPDLIISPSALPTRMTIGHLIECLQGNLCAATGYYGDATPFQSSDHREYEKQLKEIGMESMGYETMYNGFTGEAMETQIFIGPTYYQRLKQMSIDKARSRSVGLSEGVSRQPVEGGKTNGGLRFGEMEVWGLATSGAAQFLKEIMMDNSDSYTVQVCDLCGDFASKVPQGRHYKCLSCQDTRTTTVVMAYAFKLAMQELRSINISPKLRTINSISLPNRY
jgi:DNA-directed RNA polymerase II subunit RPB2